MQGKHRRQSFKIFWGPRWPPDPTPQTGGGRSPSRTLSPSSLPSDLCKAPVLITWPYFIIINFTPTHAFGASYAPVKENNKKTHFLETRIPPFLIYQNGKLTEIDFRRFSRQNCRSTIVSSLFP